MADSMAVLNQPWIVLGAVGLLFGSVGGYWLWTTLSFWRRAKRVSGTVTDLRARTVVHVGGVDVEISGQSMVYPVLQFTTHEGRNVETPASRGARPMPVRPGDEVTVLYDPTTPSTAELSIWYRLSVAMVFLTVGVVAAFFCVLGVWDISIADRFFIAGLFGVLGLPFALLGGTTLWMALKVRRLGYIIFGGVFLGIGLLLWSVFGFVVVASGG